MPLSVVPAVEVSGLVPFYPELVNSAAQGNLENTVKGHIKQCGKEAMLSCGSLLRGYDIQTGQPYMELQVGRQERPLVGPFVELVRGRSTYLVVALSGGSGGPLLCVCQPVSGRVVRAIHLAAPVTNLCLVSAQRLGVLGGGCVALATEDRCLLLLDLCLDSAHHYSDELRPASLVRLESVFSDDLPNISPVHGDPKHCFVPLCNLGDLAEVDEMAVSNGDMEVTCLQWLPQLSCLGIGLSCGTVHLWDIHKSSSKLVITLQSDLPVVSLAVQEPENDPRCCCYLWSAQTSAGNTLSSFAVTSMHALTFSKKELGEDGHHRYKDLVSGRQMFEYSLVPDVVPDVECTAGLSPRDGEVLGSRILSFRTMWSPSNTCSTSERPMSPAGTARPGLEHVEDLLVISWQLVRGSRVLGTYLSVFDINQWYRAQMPRTFRSNAFHLCSFIGLFSLEEPVAKSGNRAVLDVRVLQSSIKRFHSQNPMVDQTHFPSSLEFTCVCLTTEGTVQASFLGLQRQLLNYMNTEGPSCLGSASELYVHFTIVGLISDSFRTGGSHLSQAVAQKAVLNVALENRLVGFLVACLRAHLSGEPLLPLMLEWTWAKVKEIKQSLDILYMPLFDCSGQDVTVIGCRMSTHLEELRILNRLLEQALSMQADNRDVLCVWHEVTGLLAGHLSVLLFLVQAGLLPEHHVGDGLSYPYAILNTWCHQARNDMGGRLLVDVLAEAVLQNMESTNSGHLLATSYPPLNLQRATELYLQRGLETWEPHAITYYLLLDISALICQEYPEVKEELEDFPTVFHLGEDLQSLIQGIWYLDHGRHKEGTEKLLHAMSVVTLGMRPLLGTLWTPVVRLLLLCGQASLALLYLDHMQPLSTHEQMSLCLDVLLANCRVVDALELVRRHSHLSSLEQLLGCIVHVSRKAPEREAHALFEELLRVPLSAAEEDQLINFFCELADPMWLCHVILHFLECKRPQAALLPTAALRELFREGKAQRSYRPDIRQRAFATLEVTQSVLRLMPVPISQLKAAARVRSQSGRPVQHLGTVPTRVPHKGTTPRLVTKVDRVRVTMDPTEASKPVKLPKPPNRGLAKESQAPTPPARRRRSSLVGSGLDAEACAMLHTPPVKPWQGPTEATPSAAQPSTSTPASILKRRAKDLPPVVTAPAAASSAVEGDAGTCPTPLALDENVCPTPDLTVRRLRFAVSESFSSENTPDPDATAESMEEEQPSFVSQSEERVSAEEQASSPKEEANGSSDRSYQTAADSEEEECGTDLQDSPSEPVPVSSTPKQHLPASESVGTNLQADVGRAEVLKASPPSPGQKGLLPAFLICETARRLQGPAVLDTTFAESPGPGDQAAARRPSDSSLAATAVPSSPAKSDKTADKDDLDGTPLADEDEGTGLEGEDVPRLSPIIIEPNEKPAASPEESAASQMFKGFSNERAMLAEPVEGTLLQADEGTELADDVSHPCSEESSMTLPPMPPSSVTETHATSTKFTVVEEDSSGSHVSQPYSEESTMSLRLPAFATSKGHTVAGEAKAAEEVIVISASEGSEVSEVEQKDNDEVYIVSEASSDALTEVLPTRVDSPEDSWSRSCSETALQEGDVVLTELTSMPSAQLAEPLEMPRESSVGLVTAALDVEDVHVERSLPGYAVCPSEEEGSLPKPEDHFQATDLPVTPAQPENRAVQESYGFVPAVDSPLVVRPECGGGATLPEERALSPSSSTSSFSVVTTSKQPPAPTAVVASDAESDEESDEESDAELSEEPLSPVASSEHSSSRGGQHKTAHDSSAEKTPKTPKHKADFNKSTEKVVVTSSYNLRETRKSTWKEEENMANQFRSQRKSGPASPFKPPPAAIATRSGPSRDSDTSPEISVASKRRTRAASEEPSTPHSRLKSKAVADSPSRKREKASSVSPKSIMQSSRAKAQTPSAKKKTTKKVATPAAAGKPSKRLATPRPRRTSAAPSSRTKAGPSPDVEKGKSPSPTRASSTSPARTPTRRSRRKSATPSPTKQKAVQRATQQSVEGSPKSNKSAAPRLQEKTFETSAPLKISLRMRSHAEASMPGRTEKTPEKVVPSTRAIGTRQKRSATLSPPGRTARTLSPAQGSPVHSAEKTSPEKAGAPKKRMRHHSSPSAVAEWESPPVPGPTKGETPSKRASSRVSRTPKHSSSSDVANEPLPVSTRRSLRLTPNKQPEAKEHEADKVKLRGTQRRVLETIVEVDASPTKSDTETSPTGPSTRKGRRSLSAEPNHRAPPKRLLLATRRTRRVSGNVALATIAEAPEVEKEREPQPATSRQQGSRPKRKADTELDAEGFKLSRPKELAHKGSKSTPPKGEFMFSPPVTRYRQHKNQPSGKPADAESAPSTSKEQAPKRSDGLPRPLAGSSGSASR